MWVKAGASAGQKPPRLAGQGRLCGVYARYEFQAFGGGGSRLLLLPSVLLGLREWIQSGVGVAWACLEDLEHLGDKQIGVGVGGWGGGGCQ